MKLRRDPMPSDLAILSAEQYGTAGVHHPVKSAKAKKTHSSHADDGPRKRAKTSPVAVVTEVNDDGDEKSKRARGRPRLDTKDQTAAEVCSSPWSLVSRICSSSQLSSFSARTIITVKVTTSMCLAASGGSC